MNYYIIWYEDYLNGKLIDRDIVREETTNKIALYKDKDKAQEIANTLISNIRTVEVESHNIRYIDESYYKLMDE